MIPGWYVIRDTYVHLKILYLKWLLFLLLMFRHTSHAVVPSPSHFLVLFPRRLN